MSFTSDTELRDFLEKERALSKAKALVLFDKSGLTKVGSYEISQQEIERIIGTFCNVSSELSSLEGDQANPDSFFLGKLGEHLVYLAPITPHMCALGIFPKDMNFLKLYQSMGVFTEVLREKAEDLEGFLKTKKVEYIKQAETKPPKPTRDKFITPYQIEAILEEFKNEIGPASLVVYRALVKELGIDPKHMTRDQAYELVHRMSEKIGSLPRKQKFLKVALGIVDSG